MAELHAPAWDAAKAESLHEQPARRRKEMCALPQLGPRQRGCPGGSRAPRPRTALASASSLAHSADTSALASATCFWAAARASAISFSASACSLATCRGQPGGRGQQMRVLQGQNLYGAGAAGGCSAKRRRPARAKPGLLCTACSCGIQPVAHQSAVLLQSVNRSMRRSRRQLQARAAPWARPAAMVFES